MIFPCTRNGLLADGWEFDRRRPCRTCKRSIEFWRKSPGLLLILHVRNFHEEPGMLVNHLTEPVCPEAILAAEVAKA